MRRMGKSSFCCVLLTVTLASSCATGVASSNAEGEAFLKANAEKEGVVVLASGLQYKVIKSGPEDAKSPLVNSPCKCHYRGQLISGVEFDSSYKRGSPTTFAPNQALDLCCAISVLCFARACVSDSRAPRRLCEDGPKPCSL